MDRMQGSFEIVAPMFEAFDNGEHFAVVDIVIAFCGNTLPRPEGDGMEDAVGIRLGYDARYGEARRIGVKRDGKFGVEVHKNWHEGKQGLEFIEGGLRFCGPYEALALAEKAGNGYDDARVSLDKASIEIAKTKEHLDIENGFWNGPFSNGTDAFRIHRDSFGSNDETKEANLLNVKFAFLEFDE